MLSETDCKIILKNYLKRDDACFKNFELKPISEDAEGFMGDHYKLRITHGNTTEQFFIKTKPMKNPSQQDITQGMMMYEREIFVYETLLKEFDKYELDTSYASASYHCLPATALVLEDLTLSGYSITERHEHFSCEHVRCALDALATFHACGYAYERIKSLEGGCEYRLGDYYKYQLKESFYVQCAEPHAYAMNWWRGSRKTILKLISILETEERFANFEALYVNYKFGKVFVEDSGLRKTCGHGDLWSNNLMFKYENGVPVKCRLLDFQLTRYFYPSLDVILVIFCNTNADFRKLHLEALYKYYFVKLSACLAEYNCSANEIHPWEDFLKSIEIVMPDALTQVLLVNCIINLPKDKVSNIVNEKGNGVSDLMFDNSELVMEAFKSDAVYKKHILEVMECFYDVLAKNI